MAQEPVCPTCQYGIMHHKSWRTKGGITNQAKVPMRLGQIVSVDQLESTTPGFITQMKGKLTKQQYHYATIFVDQYSRLSYIFLQRNITSGKIVQVK